MALSDAMSLFAVITTRELACLLTVSQEAVQRRVRDGELPSWRLMDADGHALMHGLLIGWRAARASIEEQYAGRTDEVERRLQWLADIRAGALAAPVIEHTGKSSVRLLIRPSHGRTGGPSICRRSKSPAICEKLLKPRARPTSRPAPSIGGRETTA